MLNSDIPRHELFSVLQNKESCDGTPKRPENTTCRVSRKGDIPMSRIILMLALCWTCSSALANSPPPLDLGSDSDFSKQEWGRIEERMRLLNKISHLPSLLPLIMKKRDSLELTDAQIHALHDWRRKNYQKMVDTMNTIIQKRIELGRAAMRPTIDQQQLLALHDGIFTLQREVFLIRLSCRELVTSSFTEEQWSNFAFVAAEDPQIAGLLAQ
jgi:hypothetical protein